MVRLYYQAGAMDQRYLNNFTYDPLSDWWARTIADMATARLDRPICGCGCSAAEEMFRDLRTDLAESKSGYLVEFGSGILSNPFGTRKGEVKAWKKVQGLIDKRMMAAAI